VTFNKAAALAFMTLFVGTFMGYIAGNVDGFRSACADAGATRYYANGKRRCKPADVAFEAAGMRRAAELIEDEK
jgi:hypothetical protein